MAGQSWSEETRRRWKKRKRQEARRARWRRRWRLLWDWIPEVLWRRRQWSRPERGCAEPSYDCTRARVHLSCAGCGVCTCSTSLVIDPESLRRRRITLCSACKTEEKRASLNLRYHSDSPEGIYRQQEKLRAARRKKDWSELSTPIDMSVVRLGEMPEQYAGTAREVLRAFIASDAATATAPAVAASTLQASIRVLGLYSEVYAEVRDGQTVLRRITRDEESTV